MKNMSAFFYRVSTRWVTLAALILFVLFSSLTLPQENVKVQNYSHGLGSPDTHLFYSATDLARMMEAYGVEGRAAYLHARWTFDLAFPIIYTLFFVFSTSFLFKAGKIEPMKRTLFNLFPILAFIFDLAENTAASAAMAAYPKQETWGQIMAPIFTPLKWVFVIGNVVLLLVAIFRYLMIGKTKKVK